MWKDYVFFYTVAKTETKITGNVINSPQQVTIQSGFEIMKQNPTVGATLFAL